MLHASHPLCCTSLRSPKTIELLPRPRMALLRCKAKPADGFHAIPSHAPAVPVQGAKTGLCESICLLSGTTEPRDCRPVIPLHPRPSLYMAPRLGCPRAYPCSAERRNHRTASLSSCNTPPRPFAYMTPRPLCAPAAPCLTAKYHHITAASSSRGTPIPLAYMAPGLSCPRALPPGPPNGGTTPEQPRSLSERRHDPLRTARQARSAPARRPFRPAPAARRHAVR